MSLTFSMQNFSAKLTAGWLAAVLFGLLFSSIAQADGKPLDLSAYKGKVVYVDFWASWCSPCRKSFPWLNQTQENKQANGLVVLGVNVDEDRTDADQFLVKYPAQFNVLFDPKGEYATYYNLLGMPSALIFDRNGNLLHQHNGFLEDQIPSYEKAIDDALQATQ